MPVIHNREYYRALSTEGLVLLAREDGINPEMAVAMAERLAQRTHGHSAKRGFEFNHGGNTQ